MNDDLYREYREAYQAESDNHSITFDKLQLALEKIDELTEKLSARRLSCYPSDVITEWNQEKINRQWNRLFPSLIILAIFLVILSVRLFTLYFT